MDIEPTGRFNHAVTRKSSHPDQLHLDDELWQKVLRGDSAAWAELVSRYQKLVYAVVTRSGLDMEQAADCFQQTWVLLYQNRRRITNPDRISAWLVTTARREVLRVRREAARRASLDDAPEPVDGSDLPDQTIEKAQRQFELESALGQIDGRCRKLLRLMFFERADRTYEEIARMLNISSNALGPARRRCLERLKKALAGFGIFDARNSG